MDLNVLQQPKNIPLCCCFFTAHHFWEKFFNVFHILRSVKYLCLVLLTCQINSSQNCDLVSCSWLCNWLYFVCLVSHGDRRCLLTHDFLHRVFHGKKLLYSGHWMFWSDAYWLKWTAQLCLDLYLIFSMACGRNIQTLFQNVWCFMCSIWARETLLCFCLIEFPAMHRAENVGCKTALEAGKSPCGFLTWSFWFTAPPLGFNFPLTELETPSLPPSLLLFFLFLIIVTTFQQPPFSL